MVYKVGRNLLKSCHTLYDIDLQHKHCIHNMIPLMFHHILLHIGQMGMIYMQYMPQEMIHCTQTCTDQYYMLHSFDTFQQRSQCNQHGKFLLGMNCTKHKHQPILQCNSEGTVRPDRKMMWVVY